MSTRIAFTDMSEADQRLHLMLDHGFRPSSHGGDADQDWVVEADSEQLVVRHEGRQADHNVHTHIPPVFHLPPAEGVADTDPLRIEAAGEAWEILYNLIADLADRGIAVMLNRHLLLQLDGVHGDIYDSTPMPYLTGKGFTEETKEYDRPVSVPLFHPDGRCLITRVEIQ